MNKKANVGDFFIWRKFNEIWQIKEIASKKLLNRNGVASGFEETTCLCHYCFSLIAPNCPVIEGNVSIPLYHIERAATDSGYKLISLNEIKEAAEYNLKYIELINFK